MLLVYASVLLISVIIQQKLNYMKLLLQKVVGSENPVLANLQLLFLILFDTDISITVSLSYFKRIMESRYDNTVIVPLLSVGYNNSCMTASGKIICLMTVVTYAH